MSNKVQRNKICLGAIKSEMSPEKQKLCELSSEEGASSWLTALPIAKLGFMLSEQEFCDALFIRYGFQMKHLPSTCVCGKIFSVEHALTCRLGGYIICRHNDVRDTLAGILKEVAKDVNLEPALTPLSEEIYGHAVSTRS